MGVEVDPAFVQEIEHRPKPSVVEADGIPQIDLSPLLNTPIPDAATAGEIPPALSNLVAEIETACREWGFFQLINHGVPSELLDRIQSSAKEFFALPADEKRRVKRDEKNPLGYYDTEHTKNVVDWKEVFDFFVTEPAANKDLLLNFKNQWPEYPPHLQEIGEEYANEVEKLAFRILELIALTLGLPAKRLSRYFEEEQTSYIRLNHYPPCPFPDLALGHGRHKDNVVLTVLSQDEVGGLEVKRRSDGEWVRVKPVPNSYVINVGDIIQVWSNDRYESAEHRVVVNSERERFSIPFFLAPGYQTVVEPLEEAVSEAEPARYEGFMWGEYYTKRRGSNFKKLAAENIQIYHFCKVIGVRE